MEKIAQQTIPIELNKLTANELTVAMSDTQNLIVERYATNEDLATVKKCQDKIIKKLSKLNSTIKKLTYGYQIGDEVLTNNLRKGIIISIKPIDELKTANDAKYYVILDYTAGMEELKKENTYFTSKMKMTKSIKVTSEIKEKAVLLSDSDIKKYPGQETHMKLLTYAYLKSVNKE